jgi:uncharacterized protein
MTTADVTPETHPPLAPVGTEDRIILLDALRALAILGILLVNMRYFALPFAAAFLGDRGASPLDQLASDALHLFADGKFYPMFSLLFGLGLFLQMTRAEGRGLAFRGRWTRRLLVLLAFGLAHGCLMWAGDILFAYALLGVPLLLFRRRSNRTLVAWALSLILGASPLLGACAAPSPTAPPPACASTHPPEFPDQLHLPILLGVFAA